MNYVFRADDVDDDMSSESDSDEDSLTEDHNTDDPRVHNSEKVTNVYIYMF